MLIKIPKGWEIPERSVTPESAYRRRDLFKVGLGAAGLSAAELTLFGQQSQKKQVATPPPAKAAAPAIAVGPAKRNPEFVVDAKETPEWAATTYNNYYELHPTSKEEPSKRTGKFITSPWKIDVKGGAKPVSLDLDDILRTYQTEERVYRFRCVERWAMVVPWTGFPLSELIKKMGGEGSKFVRFVTVNRPDQLPGMKEAPFYPWPYNEGLRMDEAMHPLTMVVTGMYGKPLPKQNGGPIRIITPWKYGYKSPKSIQTIEFTNSQPKTLWNDVAANEYGFYSNVNPTKPHPRWSQALEELIPDGTRQRTLNYNGYEKLVAGMYNGKEH
jgi:methionine sulfoxide reductase catalytic subunit